MSHPCVVPIKRSILDGLARGQATLPKLAPTANPIVRYIEARKLEKRGLIARVGTLRPKGVRGGRPRIMWRLTA